MDLEKLIDRAADRIVDGLERVLDVDGRLKSMEKDCGGFNDTIKYLRAQLSEVKGGTPLAPGLTQINMLNQGLTMEMNQLKSNDATLTRTMTELAETVGNLKTEGRLMAWKVGTIIAVLVYLANVLTDRFLKM